MELVGQILKKNRERKNLILSDVSKELKISEEILNNIENNYLQNDIDIIFIIGHVRAYCSFLNLDEVEIVDKFKNEHLPNEIKNIEIKNHIIGKVFLLSEIYFFEKFLNLFISNIIVIIHYF